MLPEHFTMLSQSCVLRDIPSSAGYPSFIWGCDTSDLGIKIVPKTGIFRIEVCIFYLTTVTISRVS
jgi:hypothetical protein